MRAGRFITPASEWLLDNFHLITSQIGEVHRNLPRTYYRQLPSLAAREQRGRARIYAMAIELVRHSDGRFERQQLGLFLNTYQRIAPLTIGELWAWPSMLTLALVENLRRLADEIMVTRRARLIADDHLEHADTRHPLPWPAEMHVASVVQLLLRMREYGRQIPLLRQAVGARPRGAAHDRRRSGPRRASATGRDAGVGRECDHQPAALFGDRLARVTSRA